VALIVIVSAAFIAYHNSFHVPLLLDDIPAIAKNITIRHLWPLTAVLAAPANSGPTGRPLLNLSYALNYAFSGTNLFSYHITNLLIHIASALVLFGIVLRTLEKVISSHKTTLSYPLIALSVATLWTVHPLQTESVTYLSQRAELLMAFFYLLTLYTFIRAEKSTYRKSWFILSILSCFLGMACKEVMATAPLIILLYDWIFTSQTLSTSLKKHKHYYASLSLSWVFLVGLITLLSERTVGFDQGVSSWEYLLTECQAVVHYFQLALIPSPLVFDYGPLLATSLSSVLPYAITLFVLLCLSAGVLIKTPKLGFLLGSSFIILSPTSSFIPVALQPIAENRMYLPLAALCVLFVLVIDKLLKTKAIWIIAVIIGAAITGTISRNSTYSNAVSLWKDTVLKRPHSSRAQANLGEALAEEGNFKEAVTHFKVALQLAPTLTQVHYDLAKVLNNLGRGKEAIAEYNLALNTNPNFSDAKIGLATTLAKEGQVDDAINLLRSLVSTNSSDPRIYFQLGLILLNSGKIEKAAEEFKHALLFAPKDYVIRNALGSTLYELGETTDAINAYLQAIYDKPDFAEAYHNLGNVYFALDRIDEAQIQNQKAVSLKSDYSDAHTSLGLIAMMKESIPLATQEFQTALQSNPNDAEAHFRLGNIKAMGGQIDEAMSEWRISIRLRPDNPEARNNLGQGLAQTGHTKEAIEQFKEALRLRPNYPQALANLQNVLAR